LTEIVMRDPKADARYLARRAAADAREALEREQQAAVVQKQVNNVVVQEAAKSVISEYKSMHDRVEGNIRRAESMSKEARKLQLQGMGNMARQKRDSINKILADSRKLIDAFLQKHGASIPASMKQHLAEDLETLKGI
jgi:DNA-binding transcriptional regulator/RsmH inhibitor MraZ